MGKIAKVKRKWKQSGVQGVVAGALRHTASVVDKKNWDDKKLDPAARLSRKSEYLDWIRFAVPGMLGPGNIDAMDYAVANMPPHLPVVEIGSFCGLSTTVISHLLGRRADAGAMFTCDKWEFENKSGTLLGESTTTHATYRTYVRDTFLRTMQTFVAPQLPHTIECFSDEFFRRWLQNETTVDVFGRKVTLGGKIGFCYIDGNHTYDFAKRDFENTDKVLTRGGFILFDDSGDESHWEVNQLVREIARGDQYEFISKNPNYLFRKR